MNMIYTHPLVGCYQYTYPTFVDTPQHICVHFVTEDGQQAFVSYPQHQSQQAARLIPLSWFESVSLVQLAGKPQLMDFVSLLFTESNNRHLQPNHWLINEPDEYEFSQLLVA
ncbi:hypothetical protein Slin_7040 (plasmid) [Spirosoma linguale DSM 74]|uniref:Uncharacterized protein n=1 Tax=Spirosoma linguale (strain ATCC 33905 / DSM 74 / LMG 10896 / Claus 1) TaxID=504472 RepID=D2QW01_SPILD|nr:hypothetical protein Slin_7040 [Spirosoma linguale DSM 74]